MRALAFWFRDKRDRWINSRMSSRDRAVVALAGRANALAGGCLADASDAGPGQLGLALALLGATADTLDVAGQRGAVDRVLTCLAEAREAVAESLSHNSAVTVPEACRGIADVLVQEVAQFGRLSLCHEPAARPLGRRSARGQPSSGRAGYAAAHGEWRVHGSARWAVQPARNVGCCRILSLRPVHYTVQVSR